MNDFSMPQPGEVWYNNLETFDGYATIVGVAHDTETGKPSVIYTMMRRPGIAGPPDPLHACPLEAFMSRVTRSDVQPHAVRRFVKTERVDHLGPLTSYLRKDTPAAVDDIVGAISDCFRTFGGGKVQDGSNPVCVSRKDEPLVFDAAVDVADVVRFVLARAP